MSASRKSAVRGDQIVTRPGARRALAIGRIVTGFYFLWAFLDKLLGLGFATPPEGAWIKGASPTQGYIEHAVQGPFAGFIKAFANPLGDVLFMAGLAGIGTALLLGIGLRVTSLAGPALMFFMWLSAFPPAAKGVATNPIIDSHWLYALLIIAVCVTRAGDTWGLGKWWASKVGDSWLR
ncbi:hypothetical protein ACSL103130_11295 [Actinomyces slackii]|uniref:DoxX n=1 Tax=Actinomyces slackii TaxID=52774 RepID=A0A3S4UNK5_9ACTO|nr:hypothetical protein [Actinomyces slackii]VEG74664.1 Uncharacterised protein [Actinomyces slackii]